MTWTRFPVVRGADARPINAALQKDCVRGNIEHLIGESPAAFAFPLTNGEPTTASAAYSDATVMARYPMMHVRAGKHSGETLRDLDLHLFISCSNALETATFRVWGSGRYTIPSVAAEAQFTTFEVTTSVVAGEWKSGTLTVSSELHTRASPFGMTAEEIPWYQIIWLGIQAKVTGGATATLWSVFGEERET